jgi:pimeloyl-ACP methyl ester carboxylesterase
MRTLPPVYRGLVAANGTQLYYERRGSGPAVLFISGATGDADLLSDEFTLISYDRRGNSRSPRPAGWKATSTEEQADDAAALLRALGLSSATVYGNSGGAIIATCLLLRHPHAVRGAILHEPPLLSVLAGAETAPFFRDAARWLAERLGTTLRETPGAHTPQFDQPNALADVIRPLLRASI